MSKDNVVLVGFMGAGKSVCGRLLARRLGRCFVETDDMITAREGRSIPEIFAGPGEARFRQLEAETLDALALKSGEVIATGGGTPCREGRMDQLRALGTVVWLGGNLSERDPGRQPADAGGPLDGGDRGALPFPPAVLRAGPRHRRHHGARRRPGRRPSPVRAARRACHTSLAAGSRRRRSCATAPWARCSTRAACRWTRASTCSTSTTRGWSSRSTPTTSPPAPTASRPTRSARTGSSWRCTAWTAGCARSTARGWRWRATCVRAPGATCSCSGRSDRSASIWRRWAPSPPRRRKRRFSSRPRPSSRVASMRSWSRRCPIWTRPITDLPIVAQVAFTDDGATFTGRSAAEVGRFLRMLPIQALGANCSVGSSTLFEVLEQMQPEAGGLPLAIQPNAGLPSRIGERLIYLSSPAYMAEYADRMVDAGARLVGGCCGTTPQHIAAMRTMLDQKRPGRGGGVRPTVTVRPAAVSESPGLHVARPPTLLGRKLAAREFVVTVELDPPRGHTVEKLVQGAKLLKERGVDIVDINDGSLGRVRMAVLPTALLVREATGLDINMHFTCRDRNLMGIQADLLGAHALDVRNILAMTGDPPRAGDYANATAVFDVDGVGLIEILRRMNEGLDATGSSIGEPTSFWVGAALNPAAEDVEREVDRFHRKLQAGARWIQTQPIYDLELLDRFLARAGGSPVPVFVGILPLHSARHAEFLHNEVPGITIPDLVRRRLRESGDGALRAGIEMSQQLVRDVRTRYAGAYLMPSFGRFEVVAEVLDVLR
ncbi:MAG: bifunctional homocysteine S-methyltransferase/methylenetetrahydrofolate reductase [Candidatus Rokuibacteriota bacterium]|nr:MAG: bifunctional homocysteine S-methyltransferase/methylenetetrahydrofolate reductase [Candidatus Rokubacteria bacterium]